VIVKTVLVPGVTIGGLKLATAPVGNPLAAKVICPVNPPTAGVPMVYIAGCPAVTVCMPLVGVNANPAIVNVCAPEAPPPGVGFNTVTIAVPALAISLTGTAAVSCVALTNVVVSAVPFHCTIEALTKFVPVAVNVNVAPPAVAEFGEMLASVGTGLFAALIVNVCAPDAPPPGVPLKTVTLDVPELAMSLAGTAAVNCVALTNVVVSAAPFHRTIEPLMKFVPVTVNVNAAPAAVAEVGEIAPSVGTGLFAAVTVNVSAFEVFPEGTAWLLIPAAAAFTTFVIALGLKTVTEAVPIEAMSVAGTIAVNCVALTNVVVKPAPFHSATEVLMKFVPVRVSVKAAPPAAAEVGDSAASVGVGVTAALTVNVCAVEVPPPGVAVNTVTEAVPAFVSKFVGTIAVNCVALTKVVTRSAPFQSTTDEPTKFVPVTVRFSAAAPAVAEAGEIEASVGTGFAAALIVNVCEVEVPPPGAAVKTVTVLVPDLMMSLAGTAAVSFVALTNVVVNAAPFHCTTEPLTKFVPFAVKVNAAPPAVADVGEIEVNVGAAGVSAINETAVETLAA
jgi:hypothetical protein